MTTDQDTLLRVTGMRCTSCVRRIDHALRDLDGVHGVDVQLHDGQVHVRHDPRVTVPQLLAALRDAGYEASLAAAAA